tara:strand:- start:198 stop:1118 length:921 start_codon:yes stop_codon:yes gene_type:complete
MSNVYTDTKIISLNSKFGIKQNTTYNSNILFSFNDILKDDPSILNTQIEVISSQIPVSFYNINETNNQFNYALGNVNTNPFVIKNITIPVGNYNATNLLSKMNTLFIANGDSTIFNITLNKNTGRISISNTQTFSIYYDIFGNCVNEVLGLGIVKFSFMTTVLEAPFMLDLLGTKVLNICSTLLPINSFSSERSASNLLATIPINASSFSLILYENSSEKRQTLGIKNISSIDIQIYGDDNKLINFNNINWTMTLAIHSLRKIPLVNNITFRDVTNIRKPVEKEEENVIPKKEQTLREKQLQLLMS